MTIDEIKPGQTVIIRKGSKVRSAKPNKKNYVLARNQKVKVYFVFKNGYVGDDYPIKPPEISWAGAGGYWCNTDLENIIEVV